MLHSKPINTKSFGKTYLLNVIMNHPRKWIRYANTQHREWKSVCAPVTILVLKCEQGKAIVAREQTIWQFYTVEFLVR